MTNLTFLLSIVVGRPKGQSAKFLIIMWCVPLSFTVITLYHACGSLSRVLGKINKLFFFEISLDKMLESWYNKNYARLDHGRRAKKERACALSNCVFNFIVLVDPQHLAGMEIYNVTIGELCRDCDRI